MIVAAGVRLLRASRLRRRASLLLTATLLAVGCSTGVRTVRVAGSVSMDGKPVDGAQVTFTPDGGTGMAATTQTLASGEFEVQVLPGRYRITLFKAMAGGPEMMLDTALPRSYQGFATTPLVAEVPVNRAVDIVVVRDPTRSP